MVFRVFGGHREKMAHQMGREKQGRGARADSVPTTHNFHVSATGPGPTAITSLQVLEELSGVTATPAPGLNDVWGIGDIRRDELILTFPWYLWEAHHKFSAF